jgi:hypothetical protein
MNATAIHQRIRNPVTGIAFRLMADEDAWRITRSVPRGETVFLTHLRGRGGSGLVGREHIVRFLSGESLAGETFAAEGRPTFRLVVLADFLSADDVLRRAGGLAAAAYVEGRPGLRPRCECLRDDFEQASRRLHAARIAMAMAWEEGFGQHDRTRLPPWIVAAWSDGYRPWDRRVAMAVMAAAAG